MSGEGGDKDYEDNKESLNGVTEQTTEEFTNPKAPSNTPAPSFIKPLSRKRPADTKLLMMTPRVVAASQRAFSSVVMTPRAEGNNDEMVPRLTRRTIKTVKGAKQSATEKSSLGGEYVDRAVARRTAIREETKRTRDEGEWSSPIREETSTETEKLSLDWEDIRLEKNRTIIDTKKESSIKGNSKIAQLILERPVKVVESFVPGRMVYIFESGRSNPKTVIRSQRERVKFDPPNFFDMIIASFKPKMINPPKEINNDGDDIYPDVGEYVFEKKVIMGDVKPSALFMSDVKPSALFAESPGTSGREMMDVIPESIRRLPSVKSTPTLQEMTDDYYYDESDEDETALTKGKSLMKGKSSDRKQSQHDKQKFERQLKQVTKLLDEK